MFEISLEQGFQIIRAYCRNKSRLHVRGSVKGESAWSPATIADASPTNVRFQFFDTSEGEQFFCDVSLAGARLWFDPDGNSAWTGPGAYEWRSSLRISYRDGTELVLGERDMLLH